MRRLDLSEVERLRQIPGRSLLLFLTDRCPVGCAHCSVDSRRDSPTIRDYDLFYALLRGICDRPDLTLVGISGGEPFVERRGLEMAVERVGAASKDLALYTSGIWAGARPPDWIRRMLGAASCVFLSTDAFHSETVSDDRFVAAARAIAGEGAWLIVQVLGIDPMVERAERLLVQAFAGDYSRCAELSVIPPLAYGRAESLFARPEGREASEFGACSRLASPVVRYDGTVSACCNERVIMGLGPARLRRVAVSETGLAAVLGELEDDPLLNVVAGVGLGALTEHPRFAPLAHQRFPSICDACWAAQRQVTETGTEQDPLLVAMAHLRSEAAR